MNVEYRNKLLAADNLAPSDRVRTNITQIMNAIDRDMVRRNRIKYCTIATWIGALTFLYLTWNAYVAGPDPSESYLGYSAYTPHTPPPLCVAFAILFLLASVVLSIYYAKVYGAFRLHADTPGVNVP